jgi:hypothetical protein
MTALAMWDAGREDLLDLPPGTRVRWNTASPQTTRFGRVTGSQGPILLVTEESTDRTWGLLPGTDHIAVLGRPELTR